MRKTASRRTFRGGITSSSAAAYSARARIKCVVILPEGAIAKGKLAQSNAEQVAKIRRILEDLSLEIATPMEARQRLALKGPEKVAF